MHTLTFNNTDFTLTTEDVSPSILREHASSLVEANRYLWLIAKEWECAASIKELAELGVCVNTHEVVGDYFEDQTHWCPFEQKIEYMSDERVLLAPSTLINRFKVDYTFEDIAAELGYEEYAV